MSSEIQVTQPSRMERGDTFAPRSLTEAFQFADMVLVSGMAPKSYLDIYSKAIEGGMSKEDAGQKARSAIVVALQLGAEVGFQPMQALQCIASINNNPVIWGDGALALVQSSGLLEWIKEDNLETIKASEKATCQVKRRGDPEVRTVTFSFADAKKAGLFDRKGPWTTYPHRMCMMRSRAFALRDKFADVLKGLKIAEEVQDFQETYQPPPEKPSIQATVVIPTSQPTIAQEATTEASKPAEQQQATQAEVEALEAAKKASEADAIAFAKQLYSAYSKSGYLPEEFKTWLSGKYKISDSRQIKVEDREAIMKWAVVPKPKVENLDAEPAEEWSGTLPESE